MARLITAPADKVSGAEFFRGVFGGQARDRAAEAAFLEAANAHYRAAKAESNAIAAAGPVQGESHIAMLRRALAPLYSHDDWRREQARLWAAGQWVAPAAERRAA